MWDIIGDLRPIYLEDLGFVPGLEMLARQAEERYGLLADPPIGAAHLAGFLLD